MGTKVAGFLVDERLARVRCVSWALSKYGRFTITTILTYRICRSNIKLLFIEMAEEEGDDRPKNSSPPSNRRHNNNSNNGDSIATPRHRHQRQQPNSNGNNVRSNRTSRSSSSWKKSLACSVITLLCLIQYWTNFNYFMFDSKEVIIHKMMDLPQPNDPNDALHHHHYSNTHNNNNIMDDYSSYFQYFLNITTPQPLPTLVHYDPHFLGGYRNQHMRFVSFIHYAVTNSIPQILLNSLRWGVC